MAAILLFVLSTIIAWVVVRYRVHVIVVVQPRPAKAALRVASRPSERRRKDSDFRTCEQAPEIATALVNLGCKPKEARAAVERACASGATDFDTLLRIAIQEATAA